MSIEYLVEKYNKLVYKICYDMLNSSPDAQDLSQEVFLSFYLHLEEYINLPEKDIKNMKAVSKKIDSLMKDIMPIDTILTEAKQIQNLQQLIENNNNQFDLSSTQLELAKMLA